MVSYCLSIVRSHTDNTRRHHANDPMSSSSVSPVLRKYLFFHNILKMLCVCLLFHVLGLHFRGMSYIRMELYET